MSKHLSILLPVRNEGVNLKIMLKILKAVAPESHEVLVIVDSPDDETIPVVKECQPVYPTLRLVENQLGKGIINALKAGVRAAEGEFVLIFAADEVGPVVAIDDMLKLASEGCVFISCTRYAHGGRRLGGSIVGKVLSLLANRIFHGLLGGQLTDSTTGIKMFRRDIFEKLNLQAKPVGWAVVFEMSIKAQVLGLPMGEVPIVSIDRLYGGKSTFHLRSWMWEYLRWFLWGMVQLRRVPRERRSTVRVVYPRTEGSM